MLLMFGFIFSDVELDRGFDFDLIEFFVPSLSAFSVASATYTNLGVTLAIARDDRILKRVRGTPLPSWVFMMSAILSAIWIAFISAVVMLTVGILVFDVDIIFGQLPWMAAFFVVGVFVFSILGIAVANLIPSGRAAPAVTNATILPLAFISDIYIYSDSQPGWLQAIARIFPLKNFAEGFRLSFDQSIQGVGLENMGIMLMWGGAGIYFMLNYFIWVPKVELEGSAKNMRSSKNGPDEREGEREGSLAGAV